MLSKTIKTVFISDLHLGSKSCKSDKILKLFNELRKNTPETIVIIGDFIDIWLLKNRVFWKEEYSTILQRLLEFSRKGVKIIYIPGNHDEEFRAYCDTEFGNISVKRDYVYDSISNGKIWILHGDEFDLFISKYKLIGHIGGLMYDYLVVLSDAVSYMRRVFGQKTYWSFSAYIKSKAKHATKVVDIFRTTLIDVTKDKEYNGVMVGHIHQPEISIIDGINYYNTGDWIESCSYIVEYTDGEIKLLNKE